MNKVLKCSYYHPWKNSRGILQPKRNYCILIWSPFCWKCSRMLIFLCYSDLVITWESDNKLICFLTSSSSNTSYVNGVGKGSFKKTSFNSIKSTQIRIPPFFFSYTTIWLIHSNSSTGSMTPASNILSISTFTFYLYTGFKL